MCRLLVKGFFSVAGLATAIESLGVLGFLDGPSGLRLGQVHHTQGAILHLRDRFDPVEGLPVLAANGISAGMIGGSLEFSSLTPSLEG